MKQKKYLSGAAFLMLLCIAFFFCAPLPLGAAEGKVCICVMDFVNPDITGQRKFLNFENREIKIGQNCTLNNSDRSTMNSVMQGYVRMIDARDIAAGNVVNRKLQWENDRIEKEKTLALYRTVVKGEARPLLLGADYLTEALGRHPDVFTCMDGMTALHAMDELQHEPDFPQDFMLRLAQKTGITHLVYGTIADIHSKQKSYHGYGITTKSVVYELDLLIKVADLPAQKIIYSRKYTGVLVERNMSTGGLELDGNRYQTLMKSALEQAGEDLYARFTPGKEGSFKVTPIPGPEKSSAPSVSGKEKTAAEPAATPSESSPPPPTARKNETVILQQSLPGTPVLGTPVIPAPPVPVPVAAEENTTVVVTPGVIPVVPLQTAPGK